MWSTSDTTSFIEINPDTTSVYWVKITNGSGCFATDTIKVTVIPLPLADAGNGTSICLGETLTLTANGGTSYLWDQAYTSASINVSPTTLTTYYVTVTDNGCSAADSITVTINQLPVADAGSDKFICFGDTTSLTASGNGSYYWNTGDTASVIYVNPYFTTTYTVTVTNLNNCNATDNVIVTVNPLPNADAGFNQSIKFGDTITLTANGGIDYLWNTGATTASMDVSPDSSAIYYVTVTDANGCVNFDDVTILVGSSTMPYPEAYWHKNDSIISTISGVTKVGIGTGTPTERLDVEGNVVVSDMLKVGTGLRIDSLAGEGYKPDSLSTNSYKLLYADGWGNITSTPLWKCTPPGQPPWLLGGNFITDANNKPYDIGTCNNYPFKIKTSGIERMRITSTGYVAIGHTTPTAKLDIYANSTNNEPALIVRNGPDPSDVNFKVFADGHIYVRKIELSLTMFPDFVFDKDYNLMNLKELENFINRNKHLPGVPSAKEVINNGLDIGDMTSILLQKIEELTLYIIEQNKKIELMQKELDLLKFIK